jgi:hypothetical protein
MFVSERRRIFEEIGIQKNVMRCVSFRTDAFTAHDDLLCGIMERLLDVFVNMQGKNEIVSKPINHWKGESTESAKFSTNGLEMGAIKQTLNQNNRSVKSALKATHSFNWQLAQAFAWSTAARKAVPDVVVNHLLESWGSAQQPTTTHWFKLPHFNTQHPRLCKCQRLTTSTANSLAKCCILVDRPPMISKALPCE